MEDKLEDGWCFLSQSWQLVRDVVVQTISTEIKVSSEIFRSEPPVGARVELGNGLWMGPLGYETLNAIFAACSQRGLNFGDTRQFFSHYCFVREQDFLGVASIKWDDDRQLRNCIALSRLVHPTTISTHISARLLYQNSRIDMPSMIVPVPSQGMGDFAWVNDVNSRNWLTIDEALELKGLIADYNFDTMPFRVKRAMRHFDYACLTYYPDVRLTLAVTGLEAFVNTYRHRSTAQFKKRIAIISKEVGMAVSEVFAGKVYDYRSSVVHGKGVPEPGISGEFDNVYGTTETLLRKLVKKCIEDSSFASRFESAGSIDSMFPPA
jgi:hypothetical protein